MRSWFDENLAILRLAQPEAAEALAGHPPVPAGQVRTGGPEEGPEGGFPGGPAGGRTGGGLVVAGAVEVRLSEGPRGHPVLTVAGPRGERRLSSALSPEAEDRRLVDLFLEREGWGVPGPGREADGSEAAAEADAGKPGPERGLTLLGFGLGYHAEYLADLLPPGAPLWIWEARAELAAAALAARDLSGLLSRPGFALRLGADRTLPEGAPATVLARPANLRLDGDLYPAAGNGGGDGSPSGRANASGNGSASGSPSGGANGSANLSGRRAAGGEAARGPFPSGIAAPSGHPSLSDLSTPSGHPAPSGHRAPFGHPAPSGHPAPYGVPAPTFRVRPASAPAPAILFLDGAYFLGREIVEAAKSLGCPISSWARPEGPSADGADYLRLLDEVRRGRPDLVLAVNHLGFDSGGLLSGILDRLGIPAASWFVDSPRFILGGAELGPVRGVHVFSWDLDHVPYLKGLGFASVTHLPLAASEAFFRPPSGPPVGPPRALREIAFVGDSLSDATAKWLGRSSLAESDLPEVDRLAAAFLRTGRTDPGDLAAGLAGRLGLDAGRSLALEALVTWRASRLSRLEVLRKLPQGRLTVAGDGAWRELLPRASIMGRVDYYRDLAAFYRGSAVNLNVTSAQMPGGLNQRIFDVPASMAFLLTDRRRQLEGILDPGSEVAVYGSPDEARELALRHLARPRLRREMAERACRRVHAEHLHRHRLARILGTLGLGRGAGVRP